MQNHEFRFKNKVDKSVACPGHALTRSPSIRMSCPPSSIVDVNIIALYGWVQLERDPVVESDQMLGAERP